MITWRLCDLTEVLRSLSSIEHAVVPDDTDRTHARFVGKDNRTHEFIRCGTIFECDHQYDFPRRQHGFSDAELADLARLSVLGSAAPSDVRGRLLAGIDTWLGGGAVQSA